MGQAGSALGIAAALGAVGGGVLADASTRLGLPATGDDMMIGLSAPLMVGAAALVVQGAAVLVMVREQGRPRARLWGVMRSVPVTVASGLALIARSPVLRWFSVRWCVLPAGFLAVELLTPVALVNALNDPARAASVVGVVVASGAPTACAAVPMWRVARAVRRQEVATS